MHFMYFPKLSRRAYSINKYQPKPKLAFDTTQFSIFFFPHGISQVAKKHISFCMSALTLLELGIFCLSCEIPLSHSNVSLVPFIDYFSAFPIPLNN